jgi:hypothetical protein
LALGKSAPEPVYVRKIMSRLVLLILVIVLLVGGLVFLAQVPEQQPVQTIEVDVPQGGDAS